MRKSALLLASMTLAILLASGVALAYNEILCQGGECLGTPRSDVMSGTPERDLIYAWKRDDWAWGEGGKDDIYGFEGDDALRGGVGADKVSGGGGRDWLLDGPLEEYAQDTVNGGNGADHLKPYNVLASADIVNCGRGEDWARVDTADVVNDDCETVQVVEADGGVGGQAPFSMSKSAE